MIAVLVALSLVARSEDHAAAPPPVVEGRSASVPDGPPVVRTIDPSVPLQEALDALPVGSTLRLSPGVHRGPALVDRRIELAGEPGASIDGGGSGTVLTIVADDVWVHDLRITGGGFQPQRDDSGVVAAGDRFRLEHLQVDHVYLGIDVRKGDSGVVRDCMVTGNPEASFGQRGDGIRLWETVGTTVERNHLVGVRDLVVWYSDDNLIRDNVIRGSRYGTHLMHTTGNRIDGNRYEGDIVGVFVMYSDAITISGNTVVGSHGEAGVGLGFKESSGVVVTGNTLVGNTTAIYLDTTPHRTSEGATFERNLIGANEKALRFHGRSDGARFVANDFRSNRTLTQVDGRVSMDRVTFEGNHWSDYVGYDFDRDGGGDIPFEAREVSSYVVERFPTFSYFSGTPAEALVDLFAQAFPMFAPRALFSDPHPIMAAP
jgi:nitrous oxidase accessory protein